MIYNEYLFQLFGFSLKTNFLEFLLDQKVIEEMNRIGMIVDLSHTSVETQKQALKHSKAPVMYSHSAAYAICNHHRNVHDDVLKIIVNKLA